MRFLWFGAFLDFLMMVFKCMTYPKKEEPNPETPVAELTDKV